MLLEFLGCQKEAGDMYNRVLGVDPENTLALNNLAFLAADQGDNLDRAMTLAEKAKKRAPNSPDISNISATFTIRRTSITPKPFAFSGSWSKRSHKTHVPLPSALALFKQGDKQQAKAEAEKALQMSSVPKRNKIRTLVSQIG